MFDKNSELTIFEYKKIIEICNEYELYIISINNNLNELNSEKIHIIDFKEKLKEYKEKYNDYNTGCSINHDAEYRVVFMGYKNDQFYEIQRNIDKS